MTSEGHGRRWQRALERRNLLLAESAARDLPQLALQDALRLVHLYADRRSPKFQRAARIWLLRYIDETSPKLRDLAKVTASLASPDFDVT